jgi:hypothetical protein
MQLSTVVPLEGKACVSLVRRSGEGSGSQRVRMGDSTRLRKVCSSARGAANSVKSVLTSDAGPDTLVSSHHSPFFFVLGLVRQVAASQTLDAEICRLFGRPSEGITLIQTRLPLSY